MLCVAVGLSLSACAVPGLDRDPTPIERLAGLEGSMTQARADVLTALDTGTITPDQAEDITEALDGADAALSAARVILEAGSDAPADVDETIRNLNLARGVLTTVGTLLQKDYIPNE